MTTLVLPPLVARPIPTNIQTGLPCHTKGIEGYGNAAGRVAFVGIAPGKDEILRTKKPFTGPSGKLLTNCLTAIGLNRADYYCTNLICWNKDKPTPAEQAECRPRLDAELAAVAPRLIVTLGQLAWEALSGELLTRNRGRAVWSEQYQCYIMATYHPSGVLHNGLLIHDVIRDLRKIPYILEWPDVTAQADVEYRVVQTHAEAQAVLDALPRDTHVSIDVETEPIQTMTSSDKQTAADKQRVVDDIDPLTDDLTCFSVCWSYDDTVVFPPHVLEGLVFPKDVRWTPHNGISDMQVLRRHTGEWLPIVEDTMLQSYAIDERGGVHRLKQLARERLGAGFYEDAITEKRRKGLPMDAEEYYAYNAKDSAYTWRLKPIQDRLLEEENTAALYRDILMPASNVLAEMTYRGVHIDKRVLHGLFMEWAPRVQDSQDNLYALARANGWDSPKDINLNSPPQLTHLLFDILKLPVVKRTPKGAPSCDKEALEILLEKTGHPFIEAMMAHRTLSHVFNEYIVGTLDDIKRDSRIHPSPLLHGTRTGRLSYKNPPIQTLPNPEVVGEDYGRLRNMFAAETPECFILSADYKQAEVWTAYYHSNDENMLADLQRDFHRYGAAAIYQLAVELITDAMRRNNKYVAFGIMYGRQAPALVRAELKNDPTVATLLAQGRIKDAVRYVEQFIQRWLARYPDYDAWKEAQKALVLSDGELVTMAGRKRRFILVLGEDAHHLLNAGINFKIQSMSHEVLLASMVELHPLLAPLDAYILFEVHDALIIHAPKARFDEVTTLVHTIMTKPRFGMGAIPVDYKVGQSWGEGEKWKMGMPNPYASNDATQQVAVAATIGV